MSGPQTSTRLIHLIPTLFLALTYPSPWVKYTSAKFTFTLLPAHLSTIELIIQPIPPLGMQKTDWVGGFHVLIGFLV